MRLPLLLPLLLLSGGCSTTQQTPMACVLVGTKTVSPAGAVATKGVYVEVDNPLAILEAILATTSAHKTNETQNPLPPCGGVVPTAFY
jgi:hypothetical protein